MNGRPGKAKFNSLRILLDYGMNSLIVLGKHTKELCNKKTQPVKWSTQGSDFLTTHTTNVEFLLRELDATKSVTWNFHVDELQENAGYNMIIGRNVFQNSK